MDGFTATLLICLLSTPVDRCDETSAVDVLSHHVANEMQCAHGWQEMAARMAEAHDIGDRTYVRTICRRSRAEARLRTTTPHQ